MEFDLKFTIRRGDFIISKQKMIEYFEEYDDLLIAFVSKHTLMKKLFNVMIFSISKHSEITKIHFYEVDHNIFTEEAQNLFIEKIIPKVKEYLSDTNPNKRGFFAKFRKNRFVVQNY